MWLIWFTALSFSYICGKRISCTFSVNDIWCLISLPQSSRHGGLACCFLRSKRAAAHMLSLIVRYMGPTLGPSGADRTQVGPMLAPWTFLYGIYSICASLFICLCSLVVHIKIRISLFRSVAFCSYFVHLGLLALKSILETHFKINTSTHFKRCYVHCFFYTFCYLTNHNQTMISHTKISCSQCELAILAWREMSLAIGTIILRSCWDIAVV